MKPTTRKVLSILGIATGGAIGGLLGYGVARAALPKVQRPSRYPEPPGEESPPLRPEGPVPGDLPPGPLAARMGSLFGELDDEELEGARRAMPAEWWEQILAAMKAPDDESFRDQLLPIREQIQEWTDEQRDTLRSDLLNALGFIKTLELKEILESGGVL